VLQYFGDPCFTEFIISEECLHPAQLDKRNVAKLNGCAKATTAAVTSMPGDVATNQNLKTWNALDFARISCGLLGADDALASPWLLSWRQNPRADPGLLI
jgi:hypothetical protein